MIFTLFPFYWMVNTSLKTNQHAYKIPPEFVPEEPTLENFARLFNEDRTIMRFFLNSLIIGFGTVAVCLIAGGLAGYSLSRFKLPAKRLILIMILMSQMFPLALLLIPLYVYFVKVRLLDTYWAVIIAHSAISLPYCVWLLKGFIDTIPVEVEEAAAIDGCSRMGILMRIVVRMIAPGLITAGVVSFLMSWREFLYALTLTSSESVRPIGPGIRTYYFGIMSMRWANMMAAAVIITIPVILIYMFLQRYVVSGLTGGAVKG
jgi:multiple sugar transport system permease protein